MNNAEQQKKKIETVSPRTFKPELSDTDVKRLFEKAGSVGLTPEKLLENFIGDLVDGTYSNGTDERCHAEKWFDSCWFSLDEYENFLAYLIRNSEEKNFYNQLDTIDECRSELDDLRPEDFESDEEYSEEHEYYTMRSAEAEKEIQEMFSDYCDCSGNTDSYEQELEIIVKYRESLKKALSEKTRRKK